jgi:hypothetical protein
MRPLDENGYQGVTARPRIRPRIDNLYSTQHNNCQISNMKFTKVASIAGLRTTIAAAISLGAVSRYKGAEYVREFRRTPSASDSRGRDKSAIKGL